jgi:hypothetical protein
LTADVESSPILGKGNVWRLHRTNWDDPAFFCVAHHESRTLNNCGARNPQARKKRPLKNGRNHTKEVRAGHFNQLKVGGR